MTTATWLTSAYPTKAASGLGLSTRVLRPPAEAGSVDPPGPGRGNGDERARRRRAPGGEAGAARGGHGAHVAGAHQRDDAAAEPAADHPRAVRAGVERGL